MSEQAQNSPNNQQQQSIHKSDHNHQQQISSVQKRERFMFRFQQYPEVHWSAAYIDQKYYIAHPLALDKLTKLGDQIRMQKNRLSVEEICNQKEHQNRQNQEQINKQKPNDQSIHSQSHIYQNRGHIRPDSSLSRECKTQINQLRQLRNKIQVEKQLIVQQQKYKRKLEDMKRKRETNLKNNKNAQFIIRQSQRSSHSHKSGFNKSNMMAPHQLKGSRVANNSNNNSNIKQSIKRSQMNEKSSKNRYKNIEQQKQHYISFKPEQNQVSPRFKNTKKSSQINQKQKDLSNSNVDRFNKSRSISRKSDILSQRRVITNNKNMKNVVNDKSQIINHNNKTQQIIIQDKSNHSKSFVINYRRTPSNSKNSNINNSKQLGQSLMLKRKDLKSASSIGSKMQIQQLNKKIKQMQQKLSMIEIRQNQLQNVQLSRIRQLEATTSRLKTKMNINTQDYNNQQGCKQQVSSNLQKQQKQKQQKQKQQKQQKKKQQKINKNNIQQKEIDHKICPSPQLQQQNQPSSVETYNKQQPTKQNNKQQQQNSNFNVLMYKNSPKKLNFESSTVNYNYCEDMQEIRKKQLQQFEKQRMNNQITTLKKTIRELKLQKIHHESIIEQLQKRQKQIENAMMKQQTTKNNQKYQQKSQKSQRLQRDSQQQNKITHHNYNNTHKIHKIQKQDEQSISHNHNPDKQFTRSIMKKNDSSDLPVPKKQLNTLLPNKNKISSYKNQNLYDSNHKLEDTLLTQQKSIKKKTQNPQENQSVEYKPAALAKKGIIVRQVMGQDSLSEDKSLISNKYDHHNNSLEPKSPRSNGNKIFQLEFVKANNLSEQIDDFTIQVPKIQMNPIEIPDIPQPPSPDITQKQLLMLSLKICQLFGIQANENQFHMKKYKNCIIIRTPNHKKTIVWQYAGKFYIGGWQQNHLGEGKKTGEGFQYVPNKYCYQGQFYEGKKNGSGTMVIFLQDDKSSIYNGQWYMGQKHGIGKYYDGEQNSYYSGQFQHNKKQGKGVLKFSDNQFYDGTFVKSIKQGYGVQVFSNGDMYRGEYINGRFHGRGKYYWSNGSSYDGHFVAGHRQGIGKWRSARKGGDAYIGQYIKDKKEGRGQYVWANNCRYDGMFQNDLKHGDGRVEYPDGRQIKGVWQNGKLIEVDQKITQNDDNSHSDTPLRKHRHEIYESPSKELRHSKYLQKI